MSNLNSFLGIEEKKEIPYKPKRNVIILPSLFDFKRDSDYHDRNDMARKALKVVDPKGLRFKEDVVCVDRFWILVCPECNHDLEPRSKSSSFARCNKCDKLFFMMELIADKSMRMKLDGDKVDLRIDLCH